MARYVIFPMPPKGPIKGLVPKITEIDAETDFEAAQKLVFAMAGCDPKITFELLRKVDWQELKKVGPS